MSTFLFNFKPQFVPLVKSGKKRQTVRATRADGRVPRPGDVAKLYTGLRTRNTRLLMAADIIACDPVRIDFEERAFVLGGERLRLGTLEQFAKEDGFANATEMIDWFKGTHGPDDFEGFCVRWDPGEL
jgi:hypothetical protein